MASAEPQDVGTVSGSVVSQSAPCAGDRVQETCRAAVL